MYKFIRHFIAGWLNYPHLMAWTKRHFTSEQRRKMEQSDRERGIKPYKNRFGYAYRLAKVYYAHRDRYGRKCRKYNGDCERCSAKHC